MVTATEPSHFSFRWSQSARRALELAAPQHAVRALNAAARHALRAALMQTPLLEALSAHLSEQQNFRLNADVNWIDDAEMRALNARFRGKDKPTDVLSFPLWEDDSFGMPRPETEDIALGDLVISVETAARQAQDQKHDLRAEVAFLSIHGALHLLGYDHDNDSARRRMFVLQDQIFERVREEKGF